MNITKPVEGTTIEVPRPMGSFPIEISPKGLEYITIKKSEWELVEESQGFWKFRKIIKK